LYTYSYYQLISRIKIYHPSHALTCFNIRNHEPMRSLPNIILKLSLTILATSGAMAQLPELSSPSTISGSPTTAKFFGGASVDNGASFASSFNYDQKIDIDVKIQVENGQLNTMGNLYVFILWNNQYFMRVESGGYEIWDLTLTNLKAAFPAVTLQTSHTINIFDDVAFGPAGVFDTTLGIYLAYDSMTQEGEIYYSGSSLSVTINRPLTTLEGCAKSFYSDFPIPVSSDGTHRYYNFSWQSDPVFCANFYGSVPADLKDKIRRTLSFAKGKLGLLAPINSFFVNLEMADKAGYIADVCDTWPLRNYDVEDKQFKKIPRALCIQEAAPVNLENARGGGGAGEAGFHNGGGSEVSINGYFQFDQWQQEGEFSTEEAAKKFYGDDVAKVGVHEFFHAHQQMLMWYFEEKKEFGIPISLMEDFASYLNEQHEHDKVLYTPHWIEEGSAEFAAYLLMLQYDPTFNARDLFLLQLDNARDRISAGKLVNDTVSLKDYEYQVREELVQSEDNPSGAARTPRGKYDMGLWAMVYLWHKDPNNLQGIMVDYFKNWGEQENLHPREGWKYSFQETFNISIEDFYIEFDAFMAKPRAEQVSILKTNEEFIAATFFPAKR
jgi:hypothetical protein